ncbi:hypothetical protein [Paenisporosarcina sp. TG-14]|uniref:hypothetical protein n=1 Tax=Paenisporosarcina sp. TG-14 TaxID=1231057 RepID=UPI0002ECACBE|nr:hypothetical protein [Paenisporosarcina sp. TG-14]
MRLQQAVKPSREMIEKWINQNVLAGKTDEELEGTLFVYGNEAHSLIKTPSGEWAIEPQEVKQVVIFRKEETEPVNMCRACGQDYTSFKEAIQCCAFLD